MGFDLYSCSISHSSGEWKEKIQAAASKHRGNNKDLYDVIKTIHNFYNELESTGEYMRFSIHFWPWVLQTAISYGWVPEHELNFYLTNEGQIVSAEDALSLADSLKLFLLLKDIEIESWAADKIRNFIAFCQRGAFKIL